MSNLHKTKIDDGAIEDDNDNDDEPSFTNQTIYHPGGVNRIRSLNSCSQIVSTWCEDGSVYIWDLSEPLHLLNSISREVMNLSPLVKFSGYY